MAGITQNKQKALFSLWSLNKNSRNVVVSRGEKMVIIILVIVTKLTKIMIRTITVVIIIIILLLLIKICELWQQLKTMEMSEA